MYLTKPSWVSKQVARFGIHEKVATNFVLKTIKRNDLVIDLGANIGYYTLIFAKLVGENGLVLAFEPELSNFNILKKNVRENGYKNTIPENMAISNKSGKFELYLSKTNTGSNRMFESKIEDNDWVQEVEVKTLDEYLKLASIKKDISFIKMDIEGSEYFALEGMSRVLNTNTNLKIMLEYAPFA